MTEPQIGAYAHTLLDDVHAQAESGEGDPNLAFAELVLDQFSADGYSEDTRVVRYKEHGAEISGWGLSGDNRCLDLFLTQYSARADEDHKLSRTDASNLFKRAENFLTRSVSGQIAAKNRGSEISEMCDAIRAVIDEVEAIRIILVTNARSTLREGVGQTELLGRPVSRDLWDLRRLANWAGSGNKAEPIVAEFPSGLDCLGTPTTHQDYAVLLAIIPGRDLADLYSEHGARLLELNVRSFLQVRSGVNRGILETIRGNPERFLAYNNGISATASHVDYDTLDDGRRVIRRIHNMQIVNGGQTTATIHHAARNNLDVTEVLVQMKLTVISPDRLDDIVPQISAYSNTQNRVTASDLRANSGFHVEIERIMRTLWAPATSITERETHWFYERARGQYATALAREGTRAKQRMFRSANPATQRFTKSELAKYEHSWQMLPHFVSLGAEKNFVLFSERTNTDSIVVDKDFCRHLIAKTILFRKADKVIAAQSYGGYKANIVTYTTAKLVHATRGGLDLDRVWREQDITEALANEIVRLSVVIQRVITTPPAARTNVGEWAKRQECWEAVRDLPWELSSGLKDQLKEVDTYAEDLALIRSTRASDWTALSTWGASTEQLDTGEQLIAEEIARSLDSGWDPAGKHVSAGVELMRWAREVGFGPVQGF